MKHYFIDFENVGDEGLNGFFELNCDDVVDLFFTDKSNKIKIDFINKYLISENKPILNFIKVSYGPQALDLQLSSYLGSIIYKDNNRDIDYMIVSKDKGYDHVIEFWKNIDENIKIDKCKNLINIVIENTTISDNKINDIQMVDGDIQIKEEIKTETKPAKTKIKKETVKKDKSYINNNIQQVLGKNKYDQEKIAFCSSTATKLFGTKDCNMKINQEYIKKYGQEEGDKIYSLIKDILKK